MKIMGPFLSVSTKVLMAALLILEIHARLKDLKKQKQGRRK